MAPADGSLEEQELLSPRTLPAPPLAPSPTLSGPSPALVSPLCCLRSGYNTWSLPAFQAGLTQSAQWLSLSQAWIPWPRGLGLYLWKVMENSTPSSPGPSTDAQFPLEVIQGSDSFVAMLSTPVSHLLNFKGEIITLKDAPMD